MNLILPVTRTLPATTPAGGSRKTAMRSRRSSPRR